MAIDYDLRIYSRLDAENVKDILLEEAFKKGYLLENELSIWSWKLFFNENNTKGWTRYDFITKSKIVCNGVNNYSIVCPDYSFEEPPEINGFVDWGKAMYGDSLGRPDEKSAKLIWNDGKVVY